MSAPVSPDEQDVCAVCYGDICSNCRAESCIACTRCTLRVHIRCVYSLNGKCGQCREKLDHPDVTMFLRFNRRELDPESTSEMEQQANRRLDVLESPIRTASFPNGYMRACRVFLVWFHQNHRDGRFNASEYDRIKQRLAYISFNNCSVNGFFWAIYGLMVLTVFSFFNWTEGTRFLVPLGILCICARRSTLEFLWDHSHYWAA